MPQAPPRIQDLTQSGDTDSTYWPKCTKLVVKRKAPAPEFQWTIDLVYDVTEAHIREIVLPPQLREDRTRMLRAFEKGGIPIDVKVPPKAKVEVDLFVAVGGGTLSGIERVPAFVKSVALHCSPGSCRITWVLIVAIGRDQAANILDLLDSDVAVAVRTTGALPFPGNASGTTADTDTDTDTDTDDDDEDEDEDGEVVDLAERAAQEEPPPIDRAGGPVRRRAAPKSARAGRASVIAGAEIVTGDETQLPDEP